MSTNRIPVNKYATPFLLSWFIWSCGYAGLLKYLGANLSIAVIDSLVFNGALLLCAILQVVVLQYYFPKQNKTSYVLVVSLIVSTIVTAFSTFIMSQFPEQQFTIEAQQDVYISYTHIAIPLRFSLAFLLAACIAMINILFFTLQEEKSTVQRKIEAEQLAREAELFQLRSQLQPHFLFNSLNSISALAGSKPEEARRMIQQLSDFLRGTIKKDNSQLITLEEEIKHLSLYLDIEKVRFGHRLQTNIDCPDDCYKLKIPSLLLQPVLENAIKFGLYDTLEEVSIDIRARYDEPYLKVEITNPFDKDTQPAKGTGFGLQAVSRRLYLLYARTDLLQTSSEQHIFKTVITIPQ